ncbi:hypothetical protein Pla108_27700 [Botrimarina colliarenosi]|uniref:Uncharacterized protein n=1 Tax=Botrimarina colliarenosi TaxID=2528001 RepID=A0A5C6AFK4_9BACT|nr:hypothetical protein [Botrimarina colliarenosi]TWT96993.1 hypothetical protein Pla108_27700 [Botrimarina colliarenosi]
MARYADRPAWWRRIGGMGIVLLAAFVVVQAPGCSCRTETPAERTARLAKEEAERIAKEEQRLEEQRRRQPVVLEPARTLPASDGVASLFAKPGHWNAVLQPAKANANDFDGVITYEVVGKGNASFAPPGTPLRLVSRRPLVVARESQKTVDALFYCPPTDNRTPYLRSIVRERRSGDEQQDLTPPLRPLADHQYHFVVFAKEPGRYAFLDSLAAVTAKLPNRINTSAIDGPTGRVDAAKNYRVVAVPADVSPGEAALPDNPLAWTSIAYVVWDEVDPETLRPAQRDALVDWLNWGGQLIVNGPDSLDLLRGSFLEPLLPATSDGAREIEPDELERMESRWSVGTRGRPLLKTGVWTGVQLNPADGSRSLPGLTDLVIERRIGRGRVLVTAMQLADRRLINWSAGVDNLFNAAILRRPPRRFVPRETFTDSNRQEAAALWADGDPLRVDPLFNTAWRGFVRDTHRDPDNLALRFQDEDANNGLPPMATGFPGQPNFPSLPSASAGTGEFLSLQPAPVSGGAGAINDFGAVASAVRKTLRESAGVSVPDSRFVIGCLAAYLFVLVPANWGFFVAIRRVELAWAAAPLIALGAAWVVVQQAQLDIGFVRSRTEIAVLELQPDTPRGLLTRFTALYTSLSTTYEMEFDNPAVATPFPRSAPNEQTTLGAPATVAYERQEKTRLRDLAVSSATTEFVRSEEMIDIGAASVAGSSVPGAIRLAKGPNGGPRLENRTAWRLEDVMVVGRPDGLRGEARLEGCWLGDLEPGAVANVAFLPVDRETPDSLPFPRERADAAKVRGGDEATRLDLDTVMSLALDAVRYEPGERRVIARVSQVLPGLAIEPSSSQQKGATLVVGALGYGPLPIPLADANGPQDIN